MSASLDVASDWNFRTLAERLIIVKTKSENVRKAAVLDVLTNLVFTVEVPEQFVFGDLKVNVEYLANLNVFTSKSLEGVKEDFVEFFDALDIDQSIEDFIKAYWVYPGKIRFRLEGLEEP